MPLLLFMELENQSFAGNKIFNINWHVWSVGGGHGACRHAAVLHHSRCSSQLGAARGERNLVQAELQPGAQDALRPALSQRICSRAGGQLGKIRG